MTARRKISARRLNEGRSGPQGTVLLTACTQLYQQLGYLVLYGSSATGSGLAAFYRARGFRVLNIGESIPVDVIVGRPTSITTEPTERFFARRIR